MVKKRSETGEYVETVPLDDVLNLFEEVRGPAITSSDVAEAFDCTTEAARQKLRRLYDRGFVERRESGRTVLWWRSDDDVEPVTNDGTTASERMQEIYQELQDSVDQERNND